MATAATPTTLQPTAKAGRNVNSRLLIVLGALFLGMFAFFAVSFFKSFFYPQAYAEKQESTKTTVRSGADDLLGAVPVGYGWREQPKQPDAILVPATVQQVGTQTPAARPVPARPPMPLYFPAGTVHQAAQQSHNAHQQQQAAMSQSGQGYAPAQPTSAPQQPSVGMGGRQDLFQASVAGNSSLYHGSTPEEMPLDACVVQVGTLIPAALAHDVNPNMAGTVTAITSADVYDFTGTCKAIPAWSKIETTYDSQMTYGQESLQVVSTILTLPDGRMMSLGGMTAGNAQGMAGIAVDVNNHNLRLFGAAVFGALIDAAPALAGLEANVNVNTGANELASTGQLIVKREMERKPSARPIPAGTEITIKVPLAIVMNPEAL